MPDLGKYAVEVALAYLFTIVMVLGLVMVTLRNFRRAKRTLDELEARKDG